MCSSASSRSPKASKIEINLQQGETRRAGALLRMKRICWALALVFFLFVLVQYNDPDPVQWMLLYGSVSVNALLIAWQKPVRPLLWASLVVALLWALALFPACVDWVRMGMPSIVETMKAEQPWIELAREFFGLVLAAAASGWMLWMVRARNLGA